MVSSISFPGSFLDDIRARGAAAKYGSRVQTAHGYCFGRYIREDDAIEISDMIHFPLYHGDFFSGPGTSPGSLLRFAVKRFFVNRAFFRIILDSGFESHDNPLGVAYYRSDRIPCDGACPLCPAEFPGISHADILYDPESDMFSASSPGGAETRIISPAQRP